ncbi:EthD domain-containing protein [Aspergillus venezuelensis]
MSSSFTIVVFVTRKSSLSPAEFREHWENKHIPLLRSLAGPCFPLNHTRHYLKRDESSPSHPISILVGDSADITFDAFAVVSFANEAAFQHFVPIMTSPEVLKDEERFTDRAQLKAVVLGDIMATL